LVLALLYSLKKERKKEYLFLNHSTIGIT